MKHFARYCVVFLIGLWLATCMSDIGRVIHEFTYTGWDAFFKMVVIFSLILVGYNAGKESARNSSSCEELRVIENLVGMMETMDKRQAERKAKEAEEKNNG